MEIMKISNRQIAMMAFDRLRKEDKKDSALKLARCLLRGTSISLGIGDIDWDIDMAIQQCGGEPRTGYRYTAHFHFNRNTEMEKERYDGIVKELCRLSTRRLTVFLRQVSKNSPPNRTYTSRRIRLSTNFFSV